VGSRKGKIARPKRRRVKSAGLRSPAGLPDESSVIGEKSFVSPKGGRYRILRTTETDAYDKPRKKSD
jgi:hypothetical protein